MGETERAEPNRSGGSGGRSGKSPFGRPSTRTTWLLVLGALLLYAIPLTWGISGRWAYDEPTPRMILPEALQSHESWPARYPPLHRHLLRFEMAIALPLARVVESSGGVDVERLLHVLGRLSTVFLAIGTLLLVRSIARRLGGPKAGWLAAITWLGVAPQAYYAKTMNLDAPYLFWFALALFFFVEYRSRPTARILVAFALAGGCAILTKDQAYGLFALPGLAIVLSIVRAGLVPRDGWLRLARRVLLSSGLFLAVGALVLLVAATYRVWNGLGEVVQHVREITSWKWMERWQEAPNTLAGHLDLARASLFNLAYCMGWAGLFIGMAAVVRELGKLRRVPVAERTGAVLLLFPLSYYLTFVSVVRYSYDRFLLPVALVFAVLSGPFLDSLLRSTSGLLGRRLLTAAVGLALALGAARSVVVDLLLLRDARVSIEQAIAGRKGRAVSVGGHRFQYPRAFEYVGVSRFQRNPCSHLADVEFVAFNPRFTRYRSEKRFLASLEAGDFGFRLVPIPRFEPPSWLYSTKRALTNLRWIEKPPLLFVRDSTLECTASGSS